MDRRQFMQALAVSPFVLLFRGQKSPPKVIFLAGDLVSGIKPHYRWVKEHESRSELAANTLARGVAK